MNLLNGIKLFGRPIKIQFRSGNYSVVFGERRWFTALFVIFILSVSFKEPLFG